MKLVSRDPYCREELCRESVPVFHGIDCAWCGSVRTSAAGKLSLYRYWIEQDGGRVVGIPKLFCSVGCMRAYHGH